jgi:hypothetical protein
MSLHKLYKYSLPEEIKNIEDKGERVIGLLNNIRAVSALLKPSFSKVNLKQVLDAVKEGRLVLQSQTSVNQINLEKSIGKQISLNYDIDLSEAKEIVNDYIARSERGCEYCGNLGKVYKDMEPGRYCKIGDTEKSIVDSPILNNESPKIHQFWKTGCTADRTPTLRPLEEVLKEHEQI